MGDTKKEPLVRENKDMYAKIMGIFTLVVLCVFPVVYHNFYFDILETKYQFYCIVSGAMITAMLIYGLYTNRMIEYFKDFKANEIIKSLTVADWTVLVFWFANVVSWLISAWRWEAFWGTSGRYNGVFLMTIYLAVYFLMTRFFKMKRFYLDAFLAVSIFVCLFGISDYFRMDLLGFKEYMLEEQKAIYTSTFGNINTYTVYVGAVMCVATVLFTRETCMKRLAYYIVIMAISMVALIIGASDNAYLTLGALFGFLPLFLFATRTGVRRYLGSVAMFLTAVLFVGWINSEYADIVIGLGGIFGLISKVSVLPICTALLWIIVVVWAFVAKKNKGAEKENIGKWLRMAWGVVIVVVVAAVCFVLYDANVAGNSDKYEAIKGYVVFSDDWGNNRGLVWRRSVDLYNAIFTPMQKLFGYGADTLKLLMVQYYPPENGLIFDSAHNEYLNFLLTTGAVGMLSYIAFLGASVAAMAEKVKNSPEVMACMFAVIAYAVQAVVNINLPVVFPVLWGLLSMGMAKNTEETIR